MVELLDRAIGVKADDVWGSHARKELSLDDGHMKCRESRISMHSYLDGCEITVYRYK